MLKGCRDTWQVVMPLQGLSMGLSEQRIGFLVAASRATEGLVSLGLGGWIMDKYGRKAVGFPCMAFMALAYGLIPLARDFAEFAPICIVYGVGNGLSAGIVTALLADL